MQVKTPGGQNSKSSPPSPLWGSVATKTLEGFASGWRPVEELPTASRYVGGDSPNSPPSKPARGLLGGGTVETS
jgi:hypothetical protein